MEGSLKLEPYTLEQEPSGCSFPFPGMGQEEEEALPEVGWGVVKQHLGSSSKSSPDRELCALDGAVCEHGAVYCGQE